MESPNKRLHPRFFSGSEVTIELPVALICLLDASLYAFLIDVTVDSFTIVPSSQEKCLAAAAVPWVFA